MRCLSEIGLTEHNQKLLLGAGPVNCTGVSSSPGKRGGEEQRRRRPPGFAWNLSLTTSSAVTSGRSLPFL